MKSILKKRHDHFEVAGGQCLVIYLNLNLNFESKF